MSDDEQEVMDFSKEVEWPDSDTEQQESKLAEVSEETPRGKMHSESAEQCEASDTGKIPTP